MSRRIGLMASIAVLAFTALPAIASAATVPFNASLNEGKLTLGDGTVISDQALVPAGSAITIAGTLDTETGVVNVPTSGLTFPVSPFSVPPLSGTLASTATAPATGTFNPATGALTMDLQFTTVVNITTPASTCTISPINFSLTTGTGNPLGKYAAGSPLNLTTGAVSLVGYQPAIPASVATTGTACPLLNTVVFGPGQPSAPGSIELSNVPAAAGSAALAGSFSPSKVKVKKNKKAKTNVKVTNPGTAGATGVRTCITGSGGVKLKETCFNDGTVASHGTVSHNVSAKASKSGSFTATITSTNAATATATAKVTVKKKKH